MGDPTDLVARLGLRLEHGVARNSFFLTLTTFVGSALGLVFWVIAARVYAPSDLGLGAAYLSATVLVAAWADLGLSTTVVHFGSSTKGHLSLLLNSALTLVGISGVCLAIIAGLFASAWTEDLYPLRTALPLGAFAIAVSSLAIAQLIDRAFVALEAAQFTTARTVLSSLIRIGVVLALGASMGPVAILMAVAGGSIVGLVCAVTWAHRLLPNYSPKPEVHWHVVRRVWGYSAVSHTGNLLWSAPRLAYPLLVVAWLGTAANSQFYIAWMVANLLLIVPSAASSVLLARWSRFPREVKLFARAALSLSLLLAPMVALMWLAAPRLFAIFGPSYAASAEYVSPLLLSAIPFGINSLALSFHRAASATTWSILIPLTIASFCVVASAFLVNSLGVYGVCIGWLIGQTLGIGVVLASLTSHLAPS